jgi:myo-inositol-1(or 4)-monophosphatase
VSKGDLLVQEIVAIFIQQTLPNHQLISEEMAPFANNKWNKDGNFIVLDPIDGTENFVSGIKEWELASLFLQAENI